MAQLLIFNTFIVVTVLSRWSLDAKSCLKNEADLGTFEYMQASQFLFKSHQVLFDLLPSKFFIHSFS